KDVLPAGLNFVSANPSIGSFDNGSGVWTVGNLANGQAVTLQITATVNTRDRVTNYAQVSAANEPDVDSTPNNNSTTEDDDDQVSLQGTPRIDLELTKTVDNNKPAINSNVTFTITVVNKGPNNGTGIEVKDVLPTGLQYVSSSTTQGGFNPASGIWTIGNLAANQSVELALVAKMTTANTVVNYAQIDKANETDVDSTPGNNSTTEDDDDQVTLTGEARIDLSLTKVVNNATPVAGTSVTFTVTVRNDGPSPATGVNVKDLLPTGLTYQNFTTASGNYNNATGIWNVGNLAVNATANLQITALATGTPATVDNCAEVSAAGQTDVDSTPGNAANVKEDDDACAKVTTSPQRIDLELTKVVNNATPVVGENVAFTVTVQNKGPQNATNVQVSDFLPNGMEYVSSSSSVGGYNAATGSWVIGNLAVNQSVALQIVAKANATGTNCAEVSRASEMDVDSQPGNNSTNEDDDECRTITVQPRIDLELTKVVDNSIPKVGENITFTIRVVNRGPSNATGVAIKDLLPTGLTYVSNTPSVGTYVPATGVWAIGNMPVNAVENLLITAKVVAAGQIVNYAQVSAANESDIDSTPNNNSTTEDDDDQVVISGQSIVDLELQKTASKQEVLVGENVVFTIRVANTSAYTATNVKVVDILPSGFTFVSASDPAFDVATKQWTVGTLSAGASKTLNLTVTANQAISMTNCAEISNQSEADIDSTPANGVSTEDDYGCAQVNVKPRTASLDVTKAVDKVVANVGETVTYTITVRNNGDQTLAALTVNDTQALQLSAPQYTLSGDATGSGAWTGTLNITPNGGFAPNEVVTVRIAGTVPASLLGSNFRNTATVSAPNVDPKTSNEVETRVPVANLTINKQVDKTAASPGDPLSYTLTVTNLGDAPATSILVNDGAAVTNLTNPTYTVTGGTPASGNWTGALTITPTGTGLAKNQSVIIRINGTVPATTTPGTVLVNNASVASPQDPNGTTPSNPVQTVIGGADLVVAKDV
ncbi:MAG TPA: DUF11 domain-containing protein, partial [Rhodothermales bacterium]|nr:DUF11 domain-containing protein [Rhodothermales bacterium]